MVTKSLALRTHTKKLLAAAVLTALSGAAHGATQYWDINGPTAGLGGTGTWDFTTGATGNFNDSTGTGPRQDWANTNDAVFNGTATYTVTIQSGATINANSIAFGTTAGNDTITGGTALNIASSTASIVNNTNVTGSARAQIINSPIGGTDITIVVNASTATINAITTLGSNTSTTVNSFTGNLILGGNGTGASASKLNEVIINGTGIMPQGAGQKFLYNRDFSQIGFTAGGASGLGAFSGTFNNDFNLNNSGSGTFTSYIGAVNVGTTITLSGVISGSANLSFATGSNGGQGNLVLNNNATYTGGTNMLLNSTSTTAGIITLGTNNALPQATAVLFGNSAGASSGVINMNGRNQRVASIATSGTGYIGGITNTSGTVSTLTISGSTSTSYGVATGANTASSNIGATTITGVAGLTGSNDGVALVLDSANTGTTTLNRPAGNTYNGGTTINGGTLRVNNTSGSGTGSGTVTVGSGGTLGGTGTVSGAVSNAGKIAPGNSVGTITLSGGLSLNTSSGVDMEFSSTPAHDRVNVSGGTLTLPGSGALIDLFDLGSGIHNTTGSGIGLNPNYVLFNYAALSGTPSTAFTIVPPNSGGAQAANFSLNDTGSAIELIVSGAGEDLAWRGDGTGSGAWDVNTTTNWLNTGTNVASNFNTNDVVTFDDTANGTADATITIAAGGVSPSQVTVNATRNYTFAGGPINGITKVTKSGTGTLVMSGTSNTYTGGTTVTLGTLAIAGDGSFGATSGALTVSKTSATNLTILRFDADTTINASRVVKLTQTNGGGPQINTNGFNVNIPGPILCGNSNNVNLIKTGGGTLTLGGDNSTNAGGGFVNAIIVNGGTVKASQDVSLGQLAKTVTLNTGTFQFGASFNPTGRTFSISGGGGTIDTNGFNANIDGVLAGSGVVTKTGAGVLTLSGNNTHTGGIVVSTGEVVVTQSMRKSASLNVADGVKLTMAPRVANVAHVLQIGTLSLNSTGTLDMNNHDLVVDAGAFTTLEPLVLGGYRGGPDTTATGIISTTSQTIDGGTTILALFDNSLAGFADYPFGSGLTVAPGAIVGKYTYIGDTNYDGQVTPQDYTATDSNLGTSVDPAISWFYGDTNFDGNIDPTDYAGIDGALGLGQGNPLAAQGLAAVPEPAFGLTAMGAGLLLMRRRAKR
jgi:fibronectin-binding autotransporter adhesin